MTPFWACRFFQKKIKHLKTTAFWGVLILKKNHTNPKRSRFGLGGLLLPRRSDSDDAAAPPLPDNVAALDSSIFDGQNKKKKETRRTRRTRTTPQLLSAPPLPDAAAALDFSIFDGQKRKKKRGEEWEEREEGRTW